LPILPKSLSAIGELIPTLSSREEKIPIQEQTALDRMVVRIPIRK
jgi:hypothetical protein